MSKRHERIDYAGLLQILIEEFPEVPQAFDEYSKGLVHCEMGTFTRLTEQAMDEGRFWQAERYFKFVAKVREKATLEIENAIDVSYIESLAYSEVTENRVQGLKRMPKAIRDILMEIDGRGRWA